ncbi:MAG TPA: ATP synthase F0 subunit C [Bryobacteraceae bacterium]|jgi:F-type H+-transporting ATPase subunit c
MQKKTMLFLLVVLFLAAIPMFGQTPGATSGMGPGEVKFLGGMIGLGIAGGLCGIGQGKAVAGAAEAMARNPGASGNIRFALLLGLVFIETLTIYALFIVLKG